MREAFIYEILRTPRGRGKKGGILNEVKPAHLLFTVLQALKERTGLDTAQVDDVLIGCATPIGEQGGNIGKTGVLFANWSNKVAGMQLNRFDASGLEAINLAAMKIRSGWEDLVIAGGLESMSRVPMGSDRGALMYDPAVNAHVRYIPQGISADLLATLEGICREDLDKYALQSQQRAAKALSDGLFNRSLVPVYDHCGLLITDKDDCLRPDTNLELLAALPPAFEEQGRVGFDAMAILRYPQIERVRHVHTAGNSSSLADGAAVAMVGSYEMGRSLGLRPRARIVSVAVCGDEPTVMLAGGIPAAKKALQKAGMAAKDIDLWEFNEAFAAPALQFQRAFDIADEVFNVNGGAIALGHPLGASGTMLLANLLDELERRNLKTGLICMCVGGGMGIATVVSR